MELNYYFLIVAKSIAEKAHKGQTRWDNVTPYITHPETVALMIRDDFKNYDCVHEAEIVAWLHDVIEDTPVSLESLIRRFPTDIIVAIEAITHRENESYVEYLQRVSKNKIATIVKIVDIAHNLSELPFPPYHQQRRDKYELALLYLQEKLWSR